MNHTIDLDFYGSAPPTGPTTLKFCVMNAAADFPCLEVV
jgi:hypothetical protein